MWPLILGAFLPLRNEPPSSSVSIHGNTHPRLRPASLLIRSGPLLWAQQQCCSNWNPHVYIHLVVGRREAYKYIRLENPWGVGGRRLWGRIGTAGLQPQLAKGIDAQRCLRYPAQPGNSLSRKGKSEMPNVPSTQPCTCVRLSIWHPCACMHTSEFERKRKTFLQRRKIIRKCPTSYCYIYFCVRLHLFLEQNQIKKEKCFLALWKSNSMFIQFLETSKESFH